MKLCYIPHFFIDIYHEIMYGEVVIEGVGYGQGYRGDRGCFAMVHFVCYEYFFSVAKNSTRLLNPIPRKIP